MGQEGCSSSDHLMSNSSRLKSYHYAWLACHPGRTKEWLLERLADGFHVHHADGDHSNDSPTNLCLIEGIDHMLVFHGWRLRWANTGKKTEPNTSLFAQLGAKGGRVAAQKLTPRQRKAKARKAALARWSKPQVTIPAHSSR